MKNRENNDKRMHLKSKCQHIAVVVFIFWQGGGISFSAFFKQQAKIA
jgi:hypothetical protein